MSEDEARGEGRARSGEALSDVLASIRALVTAETSSRMSGETAETAVLMLTPDMRVEDGEESPRRTGGVLADAIGGPVPDRGVATAPILDEEAIRGVVNRIIREELQGELGDRINRNLRKLIRREISQMAAEERGRPE